ncbi:hypothetical protein OK016_01190 [Vibrio chagasii]|nr:hypothetical protein [Vibrio chagasii]
MSAYPQLSRQPLVPDSSMIREHRHHDLNIIGNRYGQSDIRESSPSLSAAYSEQLNVRSRYCLELVLWSIAS